MFKLINYCIALLNVKKTKESVTEPVNKLQVLIDTRDLVNVIEQYQLPELTYMACEDLRMDAFSNDIDAFSQYITTLAFGAKEGNIKGLSLYTFSNDVAVYDWLKPRHSEGNLVTLETKRDKITSKILFLLDCIDNTKLPKSNFRRHMAIINKDLKELIEILEYFGERI